jgi:hypothetical protein
LGSRPLHKLAKIVRLGNCNQILDLEYLKVNSYIAELVVKFVDVELVDETKTHLASIGTFCLFVKTISNEKEGGNDHNELIPKMKKNVEMTTMN